MDDKVGTAEYVAFMRRVLRAYGRRVAAADVEDLTALVGLRAEVEETIETAVAGLRSEPAAASWAQIGDALGVTRAAAFQRYRHVGGVRRPGGQPGRLR